MCGTKIGNSRLAPACSSSSHTEASLLFRTVFPPCGLCINHYIFCAYLAVVFMLHLGMLVCSLVWVHLKLGFWKPQQIPATELWFFLLKQNFCATISCLGKLVMCVRMLIENTVFRILNSGKNWLSAYRKTCNLLHHCLGADSKSLITWCLNHAS